MLQTNAIVSKLFAARLALTTGFVVAALAAASSAGAQVIQISGDLGLSTTNGVLWSNANTTNTTPFSLSAGAGSINGDVIVANDPTGTIFDLTITNMTYICLATNSALAGDVTVVVTHHYVPSGPGPYYGTHSLAGTFTSGPASYVQLDSIQDLGGANVSLPTLLATSPTFNLGPAGGNVAGIVAAFYTIQATLVLHTDGLGNINLPSSAHIRAVAPTPGSIALLGLAGLGVSRRRR